MRHQSLVAAALAAALNVGLAGVASAQGTTTNGAAATGTNNSGAAATPITTVRGDDDGFDLGWLGLIGLLGLAGLGGRRRETVSHLDNTATTRPRI